MPIEPYLKLYQPALKGVCLEWLFPNEGAQGEEFVREMYANCPKKFGWFHQGGSHEMRGGWHLFEFWQFRAYEKEISQFCLDMAVKFNKQLIIDPAIYSPGILSGDQQAAIEYRHVKL